MTFPIVYDVAYIDKAMTKLGYDKIIQEEAVFYQSPQGLMPTIMTSDEKVVDKLAVELICDQLRMPIGIFNKLCFED